MRFPKYILEDMLSYSNYVRNLRKGDNGMDDKQRVQVGSKFLEM